MEDDTPTITTPPELPHLDDEPDVWVDHDELEATAEELIEGNRQGWDIVITDDGDNGL